MKRPWSARRGTIWLGGRLSKAWLLQASSTARRSFSDSLLLGAGRGAVGRRSSGVPSLARQRRQVRWSIPSSAQAWARRAPAALAWSISAMAFWRSGVLIMRPRRPPDRRGVFSQHQQRRRLGQRLLFTGQVSLEGLDALLLVFGRLAQPLAAGTLPVVGLLAGGPPGLDLLGVEASLAAVGREIGLVQGGGLEDGRELVARRPTIRASVGIGQEPPLAAGIAAPDVQRCLGNPLLLGQLPQGYRVRRLQLLQNRRTALRRVGQLIPPSRPSENERSSRGAGQLP